MIRTILMILGIVCWGLLAQAQIQQSVSEMLQGKYADNSLLVRFYPETTQEERQLYFTQLGANKVDELNLVPDLYCVHFAGKPDLKSLLTWLSSVRDVMYTHPNYVKKLQVVPDDIYYSSYPEYYWNHEIVHATETWDVVNSSSLVIAILDSGILTTHEDLIDNLWINTGEVAENSIDDDGNGYIDDVNGCDIITDSGNLVDVDGHGTACASIAGARGNNATGMAGICWQVKLMGIRFISSTEPSSGTVDMEIKGIQYAIKNGAQIISMSFGEYNYSSAEHDAIKEAEAKGIVCVASAGNDASNNDISHHYPSDYDSKNVIAVGASKSSREPIAEYSNYGESVDLLAPGSDILVAGIASDTTYGIMSGTSMSAPYVAGAVALLWAYYPNETYGEIFQRIYKSVDVTGAPVRTKGRLNLLAALRYTYVQPKGFGKGTGGCSSYGSSDTNIWALFPYVLILLFGGWRMYKTRQIKASK